MTEPAPGNLWNPPADGTPDVLDALQRLASGEIVAELVTATEPAARTSPPPETPGAVTLGDATDGWAVSERTLRRHLNDGTIPGYKVAGTYGEEWRVPVTELDARYRRTVAAAGIVEDDQTETPTTGDDLRKLIADVLGPARLAIEAATTQAAAAVADAEQARAVAESAREQAEQARIEAAQMEGRLHAEAVRMEERLRAAEADRDRLAVELDAARNAPRRRWFGR